MIPNLHDKSIFVFDLDGTLAPSKSNLEPETAVLLSSLLMYKKIAVISGGRFEQFMKQFVSYLSLGDAEKKNLYLLPVTGTELFVWDDHQWIKRYEEPRLSPENKKHIIDSLEKALHDSGTEKPLHTYGEQIEDRGTQITYSALGQEAPISEKITWDPDHAKRRKIISFLKRYLHNIPITIGGMTSIDIGWDKGKALEKFLNEEGFEKNRVLFFGDALYLGGNDHPAQEIGLDCISVKDPEETRAYLRGMLQ